MEKFLWNKEEHELDQETRNELDDVKKVIMNSLIEFHNHDFRKYIENYKKYLWFVYDRLRGLDEWQTNVDYPLVASVVDTMFGNLFDFWYEFWISDPILKKRCSEAFDFRWVGKQTFKEVTKEILICGKGYVKDYLLKEEHEEVFFWKKITTEVKTPSMFYLSIFDVLYDRSKGLDKSPFKIIRTFTTWEAIKAKILPLLYADTPSEQHRMIKQRFDKMLKEYKNNLGTRFSMFTYNPVKSLASITQFMNAGINDMNFQLPWVNDKTWLAAWMLGTEGTINNEQRNNYFLHTDSSTYELIEYNTSDMKYIFINGNLCYFGPRKYNLGEIREATFSIIPGTGNSNWVADILWGLQDINNMLWNSFLDNVKLNLGPMFKINGNIPIGKNGTLDFKKFRAFKSNGTSDIEKIQLGVNDFAPVNFMQIVESFAQQRSWVSNYIMGWNGSVERVAWGIDMKFNQYKAKLTPITDSIDQMMGNIARSWILMYLKYFTKEELAKLEIEVKEEFEQTKWGWSKFKTFLINGRDIRDIIDERNITFTYNSLDKVTKENSRKTIMESLPAMLQYTADKVDMNEIIKVLAWQDFDPLKIIKAQQPMPMPWAPEQPWAPEMNQWPGWQTEAQWSYDKPYMKWSSKFMPEAPFNPQDQQNAPPEVAQQQGWIPQQTPQSEEELMAQLQNLI